MLAFRCNAVPRTLASFNAAASKSVTFQLRRAFGSRAPALAVVPFKLADIGEGISEVEILDWFVKDGDNIKEWQRLCEVQSDKAATEITSRFTGKIVKLYYKKGDVAKVGLPLVDIDVPDGTASAASEAPKAAAAPAAIKAKAAHDDESDASTHHHIDSRHGPVKVLATPAVRRIAREHKITLSEVRGTGKDGRILKEDVQRIAEGGAPAPAAPAPAQRAGDQSAPAPRAAAPTAPAEPAKVFRPLKEDRREPVRGLRRTMIKTMDKANSIPHFGYCDEIDMGSLITVRASLKAACKKLNISLSYMPFLIKAASLALLEYPVLNSALTDDLSEIVFKASHNIGVAMNTPNGLIVPNIKNCEQRSVFEIAQELNRLQTLGATGKLGTSDLTGGTFTLSNIGIIGGTYASPLINPPEVAIGAIGKIQKLPRFDKEGKVHPANIMNISWAADHRVIDGATIANFSNKWRDFVEAPESMLLHLR